MNNRLSSRDLEVKYAGIAIEYGTLALFIENLPVQQPILVMPLERSILHGSVAIYQWAVHVTTRIDVNSPIAYTTFRAAEVKQTVLGQTLIFPSKEALLANPKERAQHCQQQLQECIITLLKLCPQVSQVVAPARYRLPDEWVWSARGSDEHIVCEDGVWMLADAQA